MKKLIAMFTLAAGLSVLVPTAAEARDYHHRDSCSVARHCGSCGDAIYRQRVFVGYERCGDPIYEWRTVSHRCSRHYGRGHSHRGHGYGSGHFSTPRIHLGFGGHRRH